MCATSEQNNSRRCNKKNYTGQDISHDNKVFHLKKSLHYVRWSLKSEITCKKKKNYFKSYLRFQKFEK